jgi:hypothetical protein
MDGAPKIPPPEDKKTNEKLRKLGTGLMTAASIGIAASSPISKVNAAPNPETPPLVAEKLIVRPKDLDDQVLRDEIEANRAVFEITDEGDIKRVPGKKD